MIKKITTISLSLVLPILSFTSSFANESKEYNEINTNTLNINESIQDISFKETPLLFKSSNELIKASLEGSGGTAYLGYMSRSKSLNWRLTSSKGAMLTFTGKIKVYDSTGRLVMTFPINKIGFTSSMTGQEYVGFLKKGSYEAELTGTGTTGAGVLNVKSGLYQAFTIK